MNYQDLTAQEKLIVEKVEDIYVQHPSITKAEYVRSIAFVLNKHKSKSQK